MDLDQVQLVLADLFGTEYIERFPEVFGEAFDMVDRKSTRLNSSHQ